MSSQRPGIPSAFTSKPFYRWCILSLLIGCSWTIPAVSSFVVDQSLKSGALSNVQVVHQANKVESPFASRRKSQISRGMKAHFEDSATAYARDKVPALGKDGIYNVQNEEQYRSLMEYSEEQNMLVVLKVYAPWCKACKKLAPKFVQLSRREEYADKPILWAQLTCKDNKELIQEVLVDLPLSSSLLDSPLRKPKAALPTVQLYDVGKEKFTFPCPPSKVLRLKEKLNYYFENEYENTQHDVDSEILETEPYLSDTVVDQVPWTRTTLFPGGPVTVATSARIKNAWDDPQWMTLGQVDRKAEEELPRPKTILLELEKMAEEYENQFGRVSDARPAVMAGF